MILTALEEACSEILKSSQPANDGITYGEAELDLAAAVERLGLEEDEVEIYDIVWDDWFSARSDASWVVSVSKEPRGGMLTYNYSVVSIELPSKRRVFCQYGDTVEFEVIAVADGDVGDNVETRFLQKLIGRPNDIDIPVSFGVGLIDEIDLIWALAEGGGYILEALTDWEADWMSDGVISQGSERRSAVLGIAEDLLELDEESDEDEPEAFDNISAPPPWFFLLADADLDEIASLPIPAADRQPPPIHEFAPWERPRVGIFADPADPKNLQLIVAAFVIGRVNGRFDIW